MNYADLSSRWDDLTDDDLGCLIAQGSETAFVVFRDRHSSAIYRKAYRTFRCRDTAEWVVSESMLKVWHAAYRYDAEKGCFIMFMYGIVRHVISQARKDDNRNKRLRPFNYIPKRKFDDDFDLIDNLACQKRDALGDITYSERENNISEGIAHILLKLTPRQRLAFVLTQIEGYEYCEAARIMGVKQATNVGAAVYHARKTMQRHLKHLL